MVNLVSKIIAILSLSAISGAASAGICEYKPSKVIGKGATAVGTVIAGGSAVGGAGLQAAGYYTLVHSTTGLTMLGSTAAGASAAGTVGIVAGTGGFLGTAGAILMAPVTIIVGTVTLASVGAYEGACYFSVDRITDEQQVREIVRSVARKDPAVAFFRVSEGEVMEITAAGETRRYLLRKLYIADGHLKHRDFGLNTDLGQILYSQKPIDQ